jgi:ribosomal protein S3
LAKKKEQARLNKRLLIASRLTGIKVRIAGRLARQRVVPKRTVKTTYKGAISRSINNLVDSATFTDKNKKGAFSIRVWLSHRIKK